MEGNNSRGKPHPPGEPALPGAKWIATDHRATLGTSEDVKSTMVCGLEVTDMDENNIVFLPEVLCRPQIPVSEDEIPTQEFRK